MATYINYGEGEDDATVQTAEWLRGIIRNSAGGDEEAFFQKFKELYEGDGGEEAVSDYDGIFDLFVDAAFEDVGFFTGVSEIRGEDRVKEIESFFAVVFSLLLTMDSVEHLQASIVRLCRLFTGQGSGSEETARKEQPELRLRLLMMLYNTFNNPDMEYRFHIFKHIVDYSAAAGHFDQVVPYLEHLDSWMADWEPYLSAADKRNLFHDISRHMRDIGKRVEAFLYLKKHLLQFQGDRKEASSKEAKAAAIQLVQDALQLPSVMQVDDLLSLDAVKALGEAKEGKDLLPLLSILLSGGVDEMQAFHKKNAKVFEQHGIRFEDVIAKIRLLSLATLCQGKSEIPLEQVSKELREPGDIESAERWVVKAISEGVIDGRIDQLSRKVLVKSTFQRKFEKEEWMFLETKLSQWVDNLENLIKLVGEQKKMDATGCKPPVATP